MSRIIGAEVRHAIISNEEELLSFCEFDEDLNGNNGEEYTIREAVNLGFKNSAEYIVDKAKEVGQENFEGVIINALSKVCGTCEDYLNYDVVNLEDGRFLGFIVVAQTI